MFKTLDKFNLFIFFLIIIFFPVNAKIFYYLRPSDIFIIIFTISFLFSISIKSDYLVLLFLVFISILISTFISFQYYESIGEELRGIIYIYKILSIVIIIIGINHLYENGYINLINRILFYLFLFQILWVFIYFFLVQNNLLQGNLRVSFFLSNLEDRRMSDSHLYGNYLGIMLIVYSIYWRENFNHSIYLSAIIHALTITACLLTGSKNPLLILFLYYGFVVFEKLFVRLNYLKILNYSLFFLIIIFFTYEFFEDIILNFINYLFYENNRLYLIFSRVYNAFLDPLSTDSVLGRIKNLYLALDIASNYNFIFGRGLNGDFRYLDGIHSNIIALGGFSLLLTLIIFLFYMIFSLQKNTISYLNNRVFYIFLITFIISNVITEFVFVARWMIPIVSVGTLIYLSRFEKIK